MQELLSEMLEENVTIKSRFRASLITIYVALEHGVTRIEHLWNNKATVKNTAPHYCTGFCATVCSLIIVYTHFLEFS